MIDVKKILKKTANILPFIFIALAMFLLVHLGLSLKNDKIPSVFNRAFLYVVTPSMENEIMVGDLIFIDTNEEEYFSEDIISFRRPDMPEVIITHRIEKIENGLVTTKGDNNDFSEEWEIDFSEDLIVGKYVGKSSLLGSIYEVLFLNSLNFVFMFVIIIFLIIGVIEIKSIVKVLSLKKETELEAYKQKLIEEEKERLRNEEK
ncbi:MAG: signal peptidase I [Candidatus Izemoplasmatales bacterium]|nr:signal peptidase I [Candidatus Izemoplasmatales bacterium]